MNTHLEFEYVFCNKPSKNRSGDGKKLGENFLNKIENSCLPLKLLILFATPEFQNFQELLSGLRSVSSKKHDLASVPLVGCSTSGGVTNEGMFETGAILIGLCSDSFHAITAVGPNSVDKPKVAVDAVLKGLKLLNQQHEFDSDDRRLSLMFFPGYKESGNDTFYNDFEMHRIFCEKTSYKIPTVGGSSTEKSGQHKHSWQFCDSNVYEHTLVAALINCDVKFGLAMGSGLDETDEYVYVKDIKKDNRTIKTFIFEGKEYTPQEILSKHDNKCVFGVKNANGDMTIFYPVVNKDGTITFSHDFDIHHSLQILHANKEMAKVSARRIIKKCCQRAALVDDEISGVIAFICAGRSQLFGDSHGWKKKAHKEMMTLLGNKPVVGVYLNGECGSDDSGRPEYNSAQVSCLALGKQLSSFAQTKNNYRILADVSKAMLEAKSVKKTISVALHGLKFSGFAGAMISTKYLDKLPTEKIEYIIAQNAFGKRMEKILDLTHRRVDSDDIIAVVYKTKEPEFIPDSRSDLRCNPEAIEKSGIISQLVIPLIDKAEQVIAIIQIDLGDLSHLKKIPIMTDIFLKSYADQVGSILSQAMYKEQLMISRELDRAVTDAIACSSTEESANLFVQAALNAIQADYGHIRVLSSDGKHLKMIGGHGEYADAAKKHGRGTISIKEDIGLTASCFNNSIAGEVFVQNNLSATKQNTHVDKVRKTFPAGTSIGDALRAGASFANIVVGDASSKTKSGIFVIVSKKRWFFSQYKIDAFCDIGHRLFVFLKSLKDNEQVESLNSQRVVSNIKLRARIRDIEFLNASIPRIISHGNFTTVLDSLAGKLRKTFSAEIVSIFLLDVNRKVFFLGAQRGWAKPMIGKAIYAEGEGMTGRLFKTADVFIVEDRKAFRKTINCAAKYENEMFGAKLRGKTFEMIAFRLYAFRELLGAVVLHNCIEESEIGHSHFVTTDNKILRQVQNGLSTYLYSLNASNEERMNKKNEECLAEISHHLMLPQKDFKQHLQYMISKLINNGPLEASGIYLYNEKNDEISLMASIGYPPPLVNMPHNNDQSPCYQALVDRTTINLSRDQFMPHFAFPHHELFRRVLPSKDIKSYLAIPMIFENEILGVMTFYNIRPNDSWFPFFTNNDIAYFERVSIRVATFIKTYLLHTRQLELEKKQNSMLMSFKNLALAASKMAHPIGGPLYSITSDCDRFFNEHPQSKLIDIIKNIRSNAGLVLSEIKEFQEFVQGMSKRSVTKQQLVPLVKKVVCQHQTQCADNNIEIILDYQSDFEADFCDLEIEVILTNILNNAIEAMPSGGKLIISTNYNTDFQEGILSISDTGIGMSKSECEEACEPFKSFRETGTGFGLFIVSEFVQRHNFNLNISSKKRKGTTVSIVIPLVC